MEYKYVAYINEEQNNYLNNYWASNKSEFVRQAINKEIDLVKKNTKKTTMQKNTQSFIMLGLGALFILFSSSTNNLFAFIIIFLLGVFFMVNGLSTMGWGFFKWKKKSF